MINSIIHDSVSISKQKIENAYNNVHHGVIDSDAAALCWLPEGVEINTDAAVNTGYHLHNGIISGATGRYWIPNLFSASEVTRAANDTGSGLGNSGIKLLCGLFAENDADTHLEQAKGLDKLADALDIEWSLVVDSGDVSAKSIENSGINPDYCKPGKSLQAYLTYDVPLKATAENIKLWKASQKMLVVILRSDTAITNPARKMRRPGALGYGIYKGDAGLLEDQNKRRIQTVKAATPNARYNPQDIRDKLASYCVQLGLKDVNEINEAFRALQISESLFNASKRVAKRAAKSIPLNSIYDADAFKVAGDTVRETRSIAGIDKSIITAANKSGKKTPTHQTNQNKNHVSRPLQPSQGNNVTLPRDIIITAADGRSMTFDDWGKNSVEGVRVFVPGYDDGHDDPAGILSSNGNGTARIYSFRLSGTIFIEPEKMVVQELPANFMESMFPSSTEELIETGDTRFFNSVKTYTQSELVKGKYLPVEALTHRVTYCKTPKGAGKTELAKRLLQGNKGAGSDICLAHRRTLTRGMSSRFNLPNYQDIKGSIQGSVVCCLDSACRIQTYELPADGTVGAVTEKRIRTLVIDEISQLIRAIFSGTMAGGSAQKTYHQILDLIQLSDNILVLDADLGPLVVDFIRKALAWKEPSERSEEFRTIEYTPSEYTYHVSNSETTIQRKMIEEWKDGKRIAVGVFGNRSAKKIVKMLTKIRPDAKIGCVTGDLALDMSTELSDVNNWCKTMDAIVYSPSLGTGVSISINKHFDSIFGYFYSNVGTAQDAHQMLHRVRTPLSKDIYVFTSAGGSEKETNPENIHQTLLSLAAKTEQRLLGSKKNGALTEYSLVARQPEGNYKAVDVQYHDLYCQVLAYERTHGAHGGMISKALRTYLTAEGLAWINLDENPDTTPTRDKKELTNLRKEAKAEVTKAEVAEIYNAEAMELSECKDEPKSRAELASHRQARVDDFYEEDVSKELIERDNLGKLRTVARRFSRVKALANKHGACLLKRDETLMDGGTPGAKHIVTEAGTYLYILSKMGVTLETLSKEEKDKESSVTSNQTYLDVDGIRMFLASLPAQVISELSELGIPVSGKSWKNPVIFMRNLLKKIGVTLDCDRKRVNGEIKRMYFVCHTSFEQITADSNKYYHKLTYVAPLELNEPFDNKTLKLMTQYLDDVENASVAA